ncbi:hypothetical protein ACIBKY_53590 [Nonomuraea sp. NPDC050394]|uniref:hypothetical protein n=1 Tax=Nonomuraea sp. NPDC050394 TaxID=3364363 RepID=UPI0037955236
MTTTIHPDRRLPRLASALGLALLAPLIAEFLLGSFPLTSLHLLLVTAPLYGGAALLIREIVRRTGRGWPTMFALALAYGIFAEALVFQTFWNPDFEGLRILDYGYVPALGTSPPWIMYVLGIHTIWSISVPIALAESLSGPRRTTPWLGTPGLIVTAVVFVLGAGLIFLSTTAKAGNLITAPRLILALLAVGALLTLGLRLGQTAPSPQARAAVPSPWAMGALSLTATTLFMLFHDATDLSGRLPYRLALPIPAWLSVAIYAALLTAALALIARWSRYPGWSQAHLLALAGGATLTYAWHSFLWPPIGTHTSPAIDLAGDVVFALMALVLLVTAARRLPRHSQRRRNK